LKYSLSEKEKIIASKDEVIVAKSSAVAELLEKVSHLEATIKLLLHHQYCSRSEKLKESEDGRQLSLFDEVSAPIPEEPEPESEATTEVTGHQRKKKGGGRRPLPAALMRIRREYTLTAEELKCGCGHMMSEIDESVVEQLEIIPAVMYVVQHARKKYACKHCEEMCEASRPNASTDS